MNIFGLGVYELVLVAIIALIVAGPKRLMTWMYLLGRFIGEMRIMWGKAMDTVQKELDEAGIDFKMPKDPTNRAEMRRFAQDALRPIREPMEKAMREVEEERRQLAKTLREPNQALADAIQDITRDGETVVLNSPPPPVDDTSPADSAEKAAPAKPKDGFGTWSTPKENQPLQGG